MCCAVKKQKESFDLDYLGKFFPKRFNKLEFLPAIGASGGLLVAWTNSLFSGHNILSNEFSISVEFTSTHSGQSWILMNL